MIVFKNPGEIDIRLITTMGVNVKDSTNPIGYFGTGLKYAIAVLLREKQGLEIWCGRTRLTFTVENEAIRGKDFGMITMHTNEPATVDGIVMSWPRSTSQRLGFTTELGKNWPLKNAYRELHCNCTDEGGEGGQLVYDNIMAIVGEAGQTKIIVQGEAFDDVHNNRDDFLLDTKNRKPLFTNPRCDIYAGRSSTIFYRGIAVRKLNREAAFTYNIKIKIDLTEDRTAAIPGEIDLYVGTTLGQDALEEHIKEAVLNKDGYEHGFYPHEWGVLSEAWYAAVKECIEQHSIRVSEHVFKLYFRKEGNEIDYKNFIPTPDEQLALTEAIEFCRSIGMDPHEYRIRTVESLGKHVYGRAYKGAIWLARSCWPDGVLVEALLEEYVHLRYDVEDYSREMQNKLFEQIIRLGKAVNK